MGTIKDEIERIEDPLHVRLGSASWVVRDLYSRLQVRAAKVDPLADREEIFRLAKLIARGRRTSKEAVELGTKLGLGGNPRYYPHRRER